MKINFGIYFFILIFFVLNSKIQPQSFGFGCLGLSGFYGGYSQQEYKADGINLFAQQNYNGPLANNDVKFQKGTGFRIGANIFRAQFDDVFISLKGFFQFLKEEHEVVDELSQEILKNKYKLSMNHWGLGIDFGFPVFSFLDLKLIDGGVAFYNSDFEYQTLLNDEQKIEQKFSPEKPKIGYYVGTGLILHLIKDYISIEGTAAFSSITIDKMLSDKDETLPMNSKTAIEKGGFTGTVQLNVGFPF